MHKGFFTKGVVYALPHPPVPLRTILLICTVVRKAWTLLEEDQPAGFGRSTANEDSITQMLVEIIENRLRKNGEISGFNHDLFGKVTREQKFTNFDKDNLDKMPDIHFDLKRGTLPVLSNQDGLFVECKPIDRSHGLTTHYLKKGVIRFVKGDYAWAMREALRSVMPGHVIRISI